MLIVLGQSMEFVQGTTRDSEIGIGCWNDSTVKEQCGSPGYGV